MVDTSWFGLPFTVSFMSYLMTVCDNAWPFMTTSLFQRVQVNFPCMQGIILRPYLCPLNPAPEMTGVDSDEPVCPLNGIAISTHTPLSIPKAWSCNIWFHGLVCVERGQGGLEIALHSLGNVSQVDTLIVCCLFVHSVHGCHLQDSDRVFSLS